MKQNAKPKKQRRLPWLKRYLLKTRPQWLGQRFVLRMRPQPLIDPSNKLVLLWAPKCACTATTIWFYGVAGLRDEAYAYDHWPHRYRLKVYNHSDMWRQGSTDDLSGYRIVRIIRDPYQRAVSSFRHSLATGYYHNRVQARLGRPVDRDSGFSFVEYLDCIGQRELTASFSNPHHAEQFHPIERLHRPSDVINISKQDLFSELNRIEDDMHLPRTDFAEVSWFHSTETGARKRNTLAFGRDAADERFLLENAIKGPWPKTEELLTDRSRAKIRDLYATDFEAYAPFL